MRARVPRVSIIVATNRGGLFLDDALATVAAQTFTDYELIVVDDGGDHPAEVDRICATIRDCRVIHQPPAGVSIARNNGVAIARGSLLAFLDDDDLWHPERLAHHVAAHDRDPEAVLSYCSWRSVETSTGAVMSVNRAGPVVSAGAVAAGSPLLFTPNYVVERSAFLGVGGFSPMLGIAEDLDLVLRLMPRGPLVFVDAVLVDHRRHGANTTQHYRKTVLYTRVLLGFHHDVAQIEGRTEWAHALRAAQRRNDRLAWTGAEHAFIARDPRRFAREAWWALTHAPRGLTSGAARRIRRAG